MTSHTIFKLLIVKEITVVFFWPSCQENNLKKKIKIKANKPETQRTTKGFFCLCDQDDHKHNYSEATTSYQHTVQATNKTGDLALYGKSALKRQIKNIFFFSLLDHDIKVIFQTVSICDLNRK